MLLISRKADGFGVPNFPEGKNMDEIATATRTRAVQAPDTDLLFQPYRLGPFNLKHRILMAPLTRSRARQPGMFQAPSPPATTRNAHPRR